MGINWYLIGLDVFQYIQQLDIKFWYLVVAFIFGISSFLYYFRDLRHGHATPHPVSWFVWLLTQFITTATSIIGGGGYGAYYGIFYCFTISSILLYSLVYGRHKEMLRADFFCLSGCLHGIAIWLVVGDPLFSNFIGIAIDGYAFVPSIRDAYREPWSESLPGWALMIPNIIFSMLALEAYNWYTLPYQVCMLGFTIVLVSVCALRRLSVPRPVSMGSY